MNKKIGNLFKGDKGIWIVFFFLCLISIVEVFSASSTLSYKSQNFMGPLIYHVGMIIIGVVVAIATLNIPCRYFKLLTPILLLLSFATVVGVLIFGESINGANRVIQLPGFTFQPSELAKGSLVLATAQILSAMQREDGSGADDKAIKYILMLTLPIVGFIAIENLSTGILLFIVIFVMMFLGRIPMRQLGKLTGIIVLFMGIILTMVLTLGTNEETEDDAPAKEQIAQTGMPMQTLGAIQADEEVETEEVEKEEETFLQKTFHRFGTWRNRLTSMFDHEDVAAEDYKITDKNFQVTHANFAIASSGILGKGPGNSVERDYLPQAFSDFIFAIIIEEMGLIGAIAVVFLYVILLFRAARIAGRCENNFPAFLVMGLAFLLVLQATINMLVAVGLGPVTGQPLPLISKGGTSTIINCAYIGAILSVSRSAKRKDMATVNNTSSTNSTEEEEE